MTGNKKNLAILGSTGSIGTQTLDIVDAHRELFNVSVLTANNNWELLAKQALKFNPKKVVIANKDHFFSLKEILRDTDIEVECGEDAIEYSSTLENVDLVVSALVGYSGLLPTVKAIENGKTIALANKETLVVAGQIIMGLAKKYNVKIIPVDSEHSAIFQCLQGEDRHKMAKILLTASGGPFRKLTKKQLDSVTVKDALKHPNWNMGAKVTIDSASMMNKGFEMIEARWLFDCKPENIEILVHPQSIVHSMVQYCDGSVKAQLGVPDMHIPIQYALTYPGRIPSANYVLDWSQTKELTFEQPDFDKFPLLKMAFLAIEAGGNLPCILNAANEVAVRGFINGKIPFTRMPELVKAMMQKIEFISQPSLSDLIATNTITREAAQYWIDSLT